MAKSRAGGGIRSKNVVRKPVRTGAGARAKLPAGVNQLGNHVGNHVTNQDHTSYGGLNIDAGRGYNKTKYGNEVALNVGKGGPGKGYNVIGKSGQQGCHGPVNRGEPMKAAKALFPGWEK